MIDDNLQKRRNLVVEIFERTGDKMHPEDPAVTAALFYSSLIREAAEEVRQASESFDKQLQLAVNAAVAQAVRQEELNLSARLKGMIDQRTRGWARKATEQQASPSASPDIRAACLGLAAVVIVAAAVGALLFPELGLTEKQRLEIKVGKTILSSYDKLDKKTQEKLAQLLEQK